jgi:hypothetical protein
MGIIKKEITGGAMAYDEQLAGRIRQEMDQIPGVAEKKMFGGIGFMVNGNMACGAHSRDMIVRVGSQKHALALARPHARPFDLTGKAMEGWIFVGPGGFESDRDLKEWIRMGVEFARSLPAK